MYFDTLTITLIMVASVIAVVVMIGYILFPGIDDEREKRAQLLRAIKNLRLHEMLGLLGIPVEKYIVSMPSRKIVQQINACRDCVQISECDRCFRKGIPDANMDYCPNHKALLRLKVSLT